MSANIPTSEPARVVAGDTAKWIKSLADYPATDGWALTYRLVNACGSITFASTASGADHLVNVSAATTANWIAGSYAWRVQAVKAGEVYTVGQGQMVVEPSFDAQALDARSSSRRMLDAVEATLEGRASSAQQEYEIATSAGKRKLVYVPMAELLALRDRLRAEVAREEQASALAAGRAPRGRILVRMC